MTNVASLPAAGRELDALVAEKVMGCTLRSSRTIAPFVPLDACGCDDGAHAKSKFVSLRGEPVVGGPLKGYSTDIAAAWEVVEKLDEKWFVKIEKRGDRREEGRYFERWACHLWPGDFDAEAETAPLAICLAALKAVAP